ncbi:MAG: acyltransferase [Actinomycetales bacterium]|nr:acyltransferase [Actinomycetales bacterium]
MSATSPGGGAPTQRAGQPSAAPGAEFRGDIEGLRALAVLGVVLFHAHVPHFGGGFVGVDVFYVISGFLITGLIVAEIERTGRLSLSRFWARRMRRLLPAAALVLLVTMGASLVLLDPLSLGQTAKDVMAAGGYIANWWFAHQAVDYLAVDIPPSPVLHYWSLSVEEQFYILWPLLFAGIASFATRRNIRTFMRRQWAAAVAVIAIASFALSVVLTHTSQPYAFFSTPARAWQLALGAGLALSVRFWQRVSTPLRVALGIGGLGAVAFSFASLTQASASTPYPGFLALLPTVGTAALIASGIRTGAPTLVQRALSVRPLRFLGRISYSWYLWHWPPLVFIAAYARRDVTLLERLGCVIASLLLAAATYRFVEDPIRRSRFLGAVPRRSFAVGTACTLAVVLSGVVVPSIAGGTGRVVAPPAGGVALPDPTAASTFPPGTYIIGPREAKSDRPVLYRNGCQGLLVSAPTQKPCIFGDTRSSKTVMLFGDSHAAQWFPAVEAAAQQRHYRLVVRTRASCPWYTMPDFQVRGTTSAACRQWQRDRMAEIKANPPDVLILASIERFYQVRAGSAWASEQESQRTIGAAITSTLPTLVKTGARVYVMHDTPHMDVDVPRCVARNLFTPQRCAMPRDKGFAFGGADAKAASTVPGAAVLDFTDTLCGPAPRPCDVVRQGMVLYRDSNHVTATYARLFAPRFAALLR